MLRTLELHLTPVHGSWLHMAEIELAIFARQCLNRRIPNVHTLAREVTSWEVRRHRHQASIGWRSTAAKARMKLKRLV
jgi:hypothetical protein